VEDCLDIGRFITARAKHLRQTLEVGDRVQIHRALFFPKSAIEIGPDAHSPAGLDVMEIGVGIARKAWLEPADILNAGSADDVVAFARARRSRH